MIGSDEVINTGYTYGKVIDNMLVNVDEITLGLAVGSQLGFLDGPLEVSNDGKCEGLLIGDSLVSTDSKGINYDEGIKRLISHIKVVCIIFGDVCGITLGLDVGTDLGSLDGSFDGSNDVNIKGLNI